METIDLKLTINIRVLPENSYLIWSTEASRELITSEPLATALSSLVTDWAEQVEIDLGK